MGRTVTQFIALWVLPLGLAVLAYLTARELLSWPLLGASLSGAAVALGVIAMGDERCRRFLGADDRERQPHEVGRFLVRLASLHGLAVVGGAGGYLLAWSWAGPSYHQWLCYAGATLGGSLAYAVFLWILFAAKDPHLAGPRVLSGAELARAAKELDQEIAQQEEPPLFFAGHRVPFEAATSHFLVMGATNTGKTLIQRMLMQSALNSSFPEKLSKRFNCNFTIRTLPVASTASGDRQALKVRPFPGNETSNLYVLMTISPPHATSSSSPSHPDRCCRISGR